MSWRRELSKFRFLFRRYQAADELAEEIQIHIKMEQEANLESGMSPEEASAAARRSFGNVTRAQERSREMWQWNSFDALLQDLRYGLRQIRRNPGFTAAAVLALALGIGVNTAVFTAYKVMVARPLDARNPGEMVNIALVRGSSAGSFSFSFPDYEAYRNSIHSFHGLIAFSPEHMKLSTTGGLAGQRPDAAPESGLGILGLPSSPATNAEFASVFVVSENYFQVLGVAAFRGRTFDSVSIAQLLASPSVLISENYWQKRFLRDPAVLGKIVHLNGIPVTVAGITPHNFVGTGVGAPDFWLPLSLEPLVHADGNWLRDRENQRFRLSGRLAPGVSISQAQAEINTLAEQLRSLHDPRSDAAKPATALVSPGSPFPLPLKMYRGLLFTILLIMCAAGMVLLIACANVACLELARARSRQAEMHTRLSLGASRLRIVRQLLTESALLGLLAGAVALPFTWALLRVAVVSATDDLPPDVTLVFDVTPDLHIFAFVLAISLVSGILFGLTPAMESSGAPLTSAVRGGTSPVRTRRIQGLLIATQVALSLVLMISGSMLIRSSINVLKMETGYDSVHVVNLSLEFPEGPKYSATRKLALVQELRRRLAALSGVVGVTSARAPDDNHFQTAALPLDGEKSALRNGQSMIVHYTHIQGNYFQTLGIPLIMGRSFQTRTGQSEHSVMLSESAAKHLWPLQNPIGRSVRLGPTDERPHNQSELAAGGPGYQVIGIARDTRGVEFDGSDSRQVYLPVPDNELLNYPILIRCQSGPAQVIRAINPLISSIDPDLMVTSLTLDEMLRWSAPFISARLAAAVASIVGIIGLLLASMGIHGTVSYIVVLRTREVGIRMAVGAQKRDILELILRESTRPVLTGLLVGVLLATGASRLLRGVLYGLNTIDGISFIGVSFLFLVIALLAAYPPARKAMRVDPTVALRYE